MQRETLFAAKPQPGTTISKPYTRLEYMNENKQLPNPTAGGAHLLYSLYPICCRKSRHDLPLSIPSACH
jgi:hypothetical protein